MNNRIDALLAELHDLERDLLRNAKGKEAEFGYEIHADRVRFTAAACAAHKQFHRSFSDYLLHSRFLSVITSPVIWMCAIPIVLADVFGTVYQAVCFPIYGIPKVRRRDYLAFDRHHLAYLNFAEKFNCEYCAYVNGILAYFSEIAARTEQHWCPIKHAGCVKCAHSRYKNFLDYGDAKQYRERIEIVRQAFDDIKSQAPGA